jgi:hypothetical protein
MEIPGFPKIATLKKIKRAIVTDIVKGINVKKIFCIKKLL